jgi:hypothetical protein
MCAESVDLPDERQVDVLVVDPTVPPRDGNGGVVVTARLLEPADASWPYGDRSPDAPLPSAGPIDVPLIPYHQWANRGPSTMRVWLPTEQASLDPPQPTQRQQTQRQQTQRQQTGSAR